MSAEAQRGARTRSCTTTGAVLGRRKLARRADRRVVRQHARRVRRPDRLARAQAAGERGRTSWAAGSRLVTSDGPPIELPVTTFDQLVTVFPEVHIGVDDAQVCCCGCRRRCSRERTIDGGAHRGVGRLLQDLHPRRLLRRAVRRRQPPARHAAPARLPCHQSIFDPADSARPVGGPATRSLPQLALAVDETASSWPPPRSTASSVRSPGTKHERGCRPSDGRGRAPAGAASSSATSTRSPTASAPLADRQGAAQGLPEPLLVPLGRGRAVQLHGPADHRHVPHVLLRGSQQETVYEGSYVPLRGTEVSAASTR